MNLHELKVHLKEQADSLEIRIADSDTKLERTFLRGTQKAYTQILDLVSRESNDIPFPAKCAEGTKKFEFTYILEQYTKGQ